MNILIDELPTTLTVSGKEYEIRTDFRISLLFSLLAEDPNIRDVEKLAQAMDLYFYSKDSGSFSIAQLSEALEQILWFYKCGEDEAITHSNKSTNSGKSERILSFDHDDRYIYSSFMQEYKIDLQDEQLHWWKFRALFDGLSPKSQIKTIMGYRGMKIDSKASKSEQKFYREMKALYKLPELISEEAEKEKDALFAYFQNMGS